MGDQGQDSYLVRYRVCWECDRLTHVRGGAHHEMSLRSLSRRGTIGQTGGDGKLLRGEWWVVVGLTVEGV